jgi:ribonuclease HII
MDGFERNARDQGYRIVAGVDEAGRGPLAGPVVAAAVVLPTGYKNPEINDSKQLTAAKRETLFDVIHHDALAVGIGVSEVALIDSVNILQATLLAMKEAVSELSPSPDMVLVDGRSRIPFLLSSDQETIVKGDQKSISVAAASIVAKVSRDRIMEMYHRQFPQYNFLRNKGYGTAEHLDAIARYGCCKIHRKSFRMRQPVERLKNLSLFSDERS